MSARISQRNTVRAPYAPMGGRNGRGHNRRTQGRGIKRNADAVRGGHNLNGDERHLESPWIFYAACPRHTSRFPTHGGTRNGRCPKTKRGRRVSTPSPRAPCARIARMRLPTYALKVFSVPLFPPLIVRFGNGDAVSCENQFAALKVNRQNAVNRLEVLYRHKSGN